MIKKINASKRLKVKVLAASIASICAGSMPVLAQDDTQNSADAANYEEVVVVSKYQRSLENSLSQKRNADTVIEAIGLEDIGLLPAASIADALTALPGVAGSRTDDGNISQLSIRGTTELALTTLNGREQVTVSGNRTVEFALYPPNVMQQVQVHKSSKASLPEGGLTGVVNMQTIKPLDFDERTIVLNGDVISHDLGGEVVEADDFGHRFSVNYTDQYSDSFGVSLAFSTAKEVLAREGNVSPFQWGEYKNGAQGGGVDGFGNPVAPTDDLDGDGVLAEEELPRGFVIDQRGGERVRNSAFAALQFSPSDSLDINFDILYSERDEETTNGNVVFGGLVNTANGSLFSNTTIANDEIRAATISDFSFVPFGFGDGTQATNQIISIDEELLSTGINLKFFSGNWSLNADLSYSEASQDSDNFRVETSLSPLVTVDGFGNPVGGYSLTYSALDRPTLAVDVDLTNPANWAADRYVRDAGNNEDEMVGFHFDAEYDFGGSGEGLFDPTLLKMGVRYTDREKTLGSISNFDSSVVTATDTSPLTSADIIHVGDPDGGPAWAIFDPEKLLRERIGTVEANDSTSIQNQLLLGSGSIEEENSSLYAELSFDGTWGLPVSGNLGFRYLYTDSSSPGFATPNRDAIPAEPIEVGNHYDEFLPSFNLSFELTDTQYLRASWGRVIARAPIDELRSTRTVQNLTTSNPSGNGGNPLLMPTKADQTTLSYEWYANESTNISVSAHYSDFDTFIGTTFVDEVVTSPASVDGFGNPLPAVEVAVPIQVEGNGQGGYIRGVELSLITNIIESVGTSVNYSYTESNIIPVGNSGDAFGLTGLSKDVANASLWWADFGFEARIGVDYRSEYVDTSIFGDFETVDETTLVSMNLAYDINDDLRVSVFGVNLTDETRRKYTSDQPNRTGFNVDYGSAYGLGIYYKL